MIGKALIIDDDDAVRFVLRQALSDDGWSVSEIDDGADAESSLAANAYDLIVLDLYMPGMNGFEVLRRLRRYAGITAPVWKTRPDVPVLVVSGEAAEEGLAFARRVGANACLAKPFDVIEVQRTARELREAAQRSSRTETPRRLTPRRQTPGRPRRATARSSK